MIKKTLKDVDMTLFFVICVMLLISIICITSASYPQAVKYHKNDAFFYTKRHILSMIIGLIIMFFAINLPRTFIKKWALAGFVASIFLGLLLFTPIGVNEHGQVRSILIPIINRKIQPSDLIKISSIIFFAEYLEKNRRNLDKNEVFITILVIFAFSAGIIFFKDLSTAIVIGLSLFIMYIIAGIRPHQLVIILAIGLVAVFIFIKIFSYRIDRLVGFSGSEMNKFTYHQFQSLYAIAMGGFAGVGLFHSRQRYNVFAAHSDFIFSIICEEFGLLGAMIILVLFVIFIIRGYTIANKASNYFDKFMAAGITSYIGLQAIFNIGVTCKLFPVTGITLPFISYGGTSIIVTLFAAGLVLGISKRGNR